MPPNIHASPAYGFAAYSLEDCESLQPAGCDQATTTCRPAFSPFLLPLDQLLGLEAHDVGLTRTGSR